MSKKEKKYLFPFDLDSQEDISELPQDTYFNFRNLIEYYRNNGMIEQNSTLEKTVLRIEQKGILNAPFEDLETVEAEREDLQDLLKPLFPPILEGNEIKAIIAPFSNYLFNPTKRFSNILESAGDANNTRFHVTSGNDPFFSSCAFILQVVYGIDIKYGSRYFFDVTDAETGAIRHYRTLINADFVKITKLPHAPEITKEDVNYLIKHFGEIEIWKEKFPPKSYRMEGFGIIKLLDVTPDHQESKLKDLLMVNDVLDHPVKIDELKALLRTYFEIPDLEVGIVAFDEDDSLIKPMGFGIFQSLVLDSENEQCAIEVMGEETLHLLKTNYVELIGDINKDDLEECRLADQIKESDIGSYGLFPLTFEGKIIAVMEMKSHLKNKLNRITAKRFEVIADLLVSSVNRYLTDYEIRLEAIIKEKCTAIHPAVEWRFKEQADHYYKSLLRAEEAEMEDIDFPSVYPLYGQIDIKDSSVKRNVAITQDLQSQLKLAKKIITSAYRNTNLPYYGQLLYRIESRSKELSNGINVGDEITILDFIHREVEEAFNQIQELLPELTQDISRYFSTLNGETHSLNQRRDQYEESVGEVTATITKLMKERQAHAQAMFPHYFEKYKTDGVEHNIYIGQSIVKGRRFHQVYLKNLRLWQLMSLVEIENALHRRRTLLKVPLEVCTLVLAHSNPITIKFRMDERKFDVDGAYNIRYEIIKKRIDKALIHSTKERLTQPGKLSIVYAHSDEGREYRTYLDYLLSIGYIKGKIESYDLSTVQGISGLRALRAYINYEIDESEVKSKTAAEVLLN